MTVVASLVMLVGSHVAADPLVYVADGQVRCSPDVVAFDPLTIHTSTEAAPGGVWWLSLIPSDGPAARAFYSASGASLRAGDGEEIVPVVVHETLSVVAVAVPEGAVSSATFLLHPNTSDAPEDAVVLRVVDAAVPDSAYTLALGAPIAAPYCYADCVESEGGQFIESAPAVSLVVDEGSVVVDAWITPIDGEHSPFAVRLVDTRLVGTYPGGVAQVLRVAERMFAPGESYAVVAEVRSPKDASVLETATFVVESHDEVPFEPIEGYRTCEELQQYYDEYDGSYYGSVCGCSGAGDATSIVGLALFALALRRRRVKDVD